MTEQPQTIIDVGREAFSTLMLQEVPGSLLVLSILLNIILLAPLVWRSIRSKRNG